MASQPQKIIKIVRPKPQLQTQHIYHYVERKESTSCGAGILYCLLGILLGPFGILLAAIAGKLSGLMSALVGWIIVWGGFIVVLVMNLPKP